MLLDSWILWFLLTFTPLALLQFFLLYKEISKDKEEEALSKQRKLYKGKFVELEKEIQKLNIEIEKLKEKNK